MSAHTRLYTEMVVAEALIYGDQNRFLNHSEEEFPVALQLGGSDHQVLARAAKLGAERGFDEINLNVGCPSERVKSGHFGASLMAEPNLVATCVAAMREVVDVPVTVKTRIGIDHHDSYEQLWQFVETVAAAGCEVFMIHARKAWLQGLSPRENREIPPLRYDIVRQLKKDFPSLVIVANGGIKTVRNWHEHLRDFDGVMVGRAAYETPFILSQVDQQIFAQDEKPLDRFAIFERYLAYAEKEIANDTYVRHLAKPLHYLFQGQPGARQWRRHLSEHCNAPSADLEALRSAVRCVERVSA